MFTLLLYGWAGLTVVLVVLLIYRALLGLHEEDQIFLDRAEAALEQEQVEVLRKIRRIDPIVKGLAIASGSLLVILIGVWIYRGLYAPVVL